MDELELRRERQRQYRQMRDAQRKEKQNKMKNRLMIAAIVLLAVAAVILLISLGGGEAAPSQTKPATPPDLEATQAPSGQTLAPTETQPKESKITITAVGDLNVTEKTVAAGGAGYDYTQVFTDVLPVLANSDLTVVNLEGILCGAPYGTEDHSAPQTMVTALSAAGVDLVQTANSYTIKNGVQGLSMTLSGLQAAGLDSVGAYARDEDYAESGGFTLREVNGIKVAFVALTKGMDGMALPADSGRVVNLLYTDYSSTYKNIDREGITALLERVADAQPDVVIALVHWGSEYNDTHSESQKTIRDLLLKNGVDAIIGTHPHYVQQLEHDAAAGTLVAYSLGDFLSDTERSGTEYSIALHLEFTKDSLTGQTTLTDYSYTPLFTAKAEAGGLRVLRLESAMAAYTQEYIGAVDEQTYNAMLYAQERIAARVQPAEKEGE